MKGTLSEEQIHNLLVTIETMLRSTSLTLTWERGIRRIDNWDTGKVELSPTEGQTLTLTVHGGARDIDGGVILGGQENPIAGRRRRGKK